ncbi:RNA polymerase sigma-70 factor (ECF subfamily) [Chitinophaga skermanii]|uniref:RNA polymerase sigma factor n=1 Tax=Chitinophaga skermanii TaxID=331697 RepID=A0A327QVB8_9BACT|nr:RNA polymerase sigma factor [Chitinophaga skermanii]RAJ08320.1 RNA polymerase sigma-70 factor (ECF subfamily) [Chitinophaga skermanii]
MANLLDQELERARQGDGNAMNALLEKHRDLAYSIALKYCHDSNAAEDIVQDALLKVFLHIHQFRGEAAFSSWLYRIVYYEAIRHMQQRQRYMSMSEEAAEILEEANSEDTTSNMHPELMHAMRILTPNEYLVINLFYLSEKPVKEIADITGQSASSVKVLLHRARKKMAGAMESQSSNKISS